MIMVPFIFVDEPPSNFTWTGFNTSRSQWSIAFPFLDSSGNRYSRNFSWNSANLLSCLFLTIYLSTWIAASSSSGNLAFSMLIPRSSLSSGSYSCSLDLSLLSCTSLVSCLAINLIVGFDISVSFLFLPTLAIISGSGSSMAFGSVRS